MAVKTFTSERLTSSDVNTYLTNSGLVYVAQNTFTNSSAVTIDNCFTSTFRNYRILCDVTSSTGGAAEIQVLLRAGGSDNSTSNYSSAGFGGPWAGPTASLTSTPRTNWYALRTNGSGSLGGSFAGYLEVYSPQLSNYYTYATSATQDGGEFGTRNHKFNLTTQFDGFKLQNSGGGQMTGVITVYGYRIS